jgi:hypothetical protein
MGVSSSEPSFTVFHIGRAAGATKGASRLRCEAASIGDTMTAAVRGAAA